MDLYTMTQNFLPDQPINNFVSAIWTERFFSAGEVQIVVPATSEMAKLFAEGTFLGVRGSREVMILDTHDVKDGLLTVKGDTLVKFLDERMAWFRSRATSSEVSEYQEENNAGTVLINVLNRTLLAPFGDLGNNNLDWTRDKIPNLTLGEMDTGGDSWPRTFPIGTLYSGLESYVKKEGMGFRIYLESASDTGYALKFMAYRGRDRTSGQKVNPLIRLSPHMDSLADIKEILSISQYKNVLYIHYSNKIFTYYAEPTLPIPEGFNRRVMVKEASGVPGPSGQVNWLLQQAKDAFANNNYIRAVDGQASLLIPYKYQKDYRLGDILELEGFSGTLSKARVTEYIRVHDSLGHREYPTISVVDPLDTGNWPALNTNPDSSDQWDDDTNPFDNFFDNLDFGDGTDYPSNPYNPYPRNKNPSPAPAPTPDPGPPETIGGGDVEDAGTGPMSAVYVNIFHKLSTPLMVKNNGADNFVEFRSPSGKLTGTDGQFHMYATGGGPNNWSTKVYVKNMSAVSRTIKIRSQLILPHPDDWQSIYTLAPGEVKVVYSSSFGERPSARYAVWIKVADNVGTDFLYRATVKFAQFDLWTPPAGW